MSEDILSNIESELKKIQLEKNEIEARLEKITDQIAKAAAKEAFPLCWELTRTFSALELERDEKELTIKSLQESVFMLAKEQQPQKPKKITKSLDKRFNSL